MGLVVALDASATADGRRAAGIGRYAVELIGALRGLDPPGLELHAVAPTRPPRSERWWFRFGHAQSGLAIAVLRHRPHVLHGLASDAAACFPPARQIVTVHDVVPWQTAGSAGPATRSYLAAQRYLLARAGAVIVPGDPIAADVVDELGIAEERITVIPHGISSAFSATVGPDDGGVRRSLELPDRYLLWVGSLHGPDPRKGLDLLIDALAELEATVRLPLVLVGRTGAGADWIRARAEGRGVQTVLTGYVEDRELAAVYRGAAAAIVPSRYEGFGLPALEALACGTALLATDAGTLPSVVGDAALMVPAGSPEPLAEGLRELLDRDELRNGLRRAGPERAAHFSWSRAAKRTLEVYERLAHTRETQSR